jgi:citrate lyase subunit gamma (acyl carrier protein)
MVIQKEAVCGTLQSNDCLVRIAPFPKGIELTIASPVLARFGEQIEKAVRDTLSALDVHACRLFLEDKGALDYTIRARVETAVRRAHE